MCKRGSEKPRQTAGIVREQDRNNSTIHRSQTMDHNAAIFSKGPIWSLEKAAKKRYENPKRKTCPKQMTTKINRAATRRPRARRDRRVSLRATVNTLRYSPKRRFRVPVFSGLFGCVAALGSCLAIILDSVGK
jgi:hypothetical protein